MFERSRKISLIVAPHGSPKSWNRVVPLPILVGIGAASVALLLLFLVLIVQVAELSARARETAALREENAALLERSRRIDDLEIELTRLRELETRVRHWAGIESDGSVAGPGREELARRWERDEELLAEIPTLRPVEGWISRGFDSGPEAHVGVDLVGKTGTEVRASAPGVVRFAGWDDIFGHLVVLDHGHGFSTSYGHNESLLVEEGQQVPRGHIIARLGSTGRSSAPHLHFEVRLEDEPLDPAYLLVSET
jgi:murein DD-endopeptidase MepM/ murein hydrolase activator NlpD